MMIDSKNLIMITQYHEKRTITSILGIPVMSKVIKKTS